MNKKNIIMTIQLGMIIILAVLLFNSNKAVSELHTSVNGYVNDSTYMVTYYSKAIKDLKKENKDLYDRIKKQDNVSSAIQFMYFYKFKTDTMFVDKNDTSLIKNYEVNTDTISYKLRIKSPQIEWYTLDFQLNDKLTIINRKDGNSNETTITNSNGNGNVGNVTVYTPKEKKSFLDKFAIGPQISIGVNPYNMKTPEIYIGFGITYNLLK